MKKPILFEEFETYPDEIEDWLEDDELSAEEAAFMHGYDEAG
jgi:hypothetical protein